MQTWLLFRGKLWESLIRARSGRGGKGTISFRFSLADWENLVKGEKPETKGDKCPEGMVCYPGYGENLCQIQIFVGIL